MNARTLSEQLFLPSRMGYLKQLERLMIPVEDYVEMYNQVKLIPIFIKKEAYASFFFQIKS